jgi:hypothetical protein
VSDAADQKDAARMDAALHLSIPDDLPGCQALIEQLACTIDTQYNTINSQTDTIEQLRREKQELELTLSCTRTVR